jgi:serine/threonine protein kinase
MCPECGNPYIRGGKFCAHCGSLRSSLDLDLLEADGEVASLPPGTMVGNYRVIDLLGHGGMGHVYVAEHIKLGRLVAIKKLRGELASNPIAVARFFAEARAVNRISHENIVEITDLLEQPGGDNFIIMELLKGEDLGQRLRRTRALPLLRALDIVAQTASALAAVHRAGMIHRDLKPDNIFLIERRGSSDFVKVLDFGVAKLTDVDGRGGIAVHTTAAGQIIGTPEYMSPEQASGAPVDYRTDIYALGVILYEMITGALPFQAKNFGELMIKHMAAPVTLPALQPGLPHGVQSARDDLLLDLLAKDPNDRPRSMDDVELRIRALLDTMELPLAPKKRTPSVDDLMLPLERVAPPPPGGVAKQGEQSRSAEAVAKVALVKGATPQAAVEIAMPRSVCRIEVVTSPGGGAAPPGARTATRGLEQRAPTARSPVPTPERLAKSSADMRPPWPSNTAPPTPPGSADNREADPVERSRAEPPVKRSGSTSPPAGLAPRRASDGLASESRRRAASDPGSPAAGQPGQDGRLDGRRVAGSNPGIMTPGPRSGNARADAQPVAGSNPAIATPEQHSGRSGQGAQRVVGSNPAIPAAEQPAGPSARDVRVAASDAVVAPRSAAPAVALKRRSVAVPEDPVQTPSSGAGRPATRVLRPILAAAVVGAFVGAAVVWFALDRGWPSPSGATSPPARAAEVQIKFVSAPPGATVRLVGANEPLGVTPFARRFPRGERAMTVEFAKPGFATLTQDITLAGDDAIATALTPLVAAPPPPAAASPPSAPGAALPVQPNHPEPIHKRAPAKRTPPPPSERPLDRNGTLDVFEKK